MTVIYDVRFSNLKSQDLLTANRVMCDLLEGLPEHIDIRKWQVTPSKIVAQYSPYPRTDEQVRLNMAELADVFGLEYSEERCVGLTHGSFTGVKAAGFRDGVYVEFWAHVDKSAVAA